MRKFLSLIIMSVVLASCSSTTVINVTDKKAKVYVDGEYRGKGSVMHTDTKIVGATTQVMIKKKGCSPMTYTFSRSEVFDAGACAGGVFVLFPFLWVMKYKPSRTFEYECSKE